MKTHIVTTSIKLTDEQIEDIMASVLTGCTYWADDAKLSSPQPEQGLFISEALTHGCKIKIHDAEEDKWHEVTLESFLKALGDTPRFNYDDYDSLEAEQVLQKAIFGKVLYG